MNSSNLARRLAVGALTLAIPAAAVVGPLSGTAAAAARAKRAPAPVFTTRPASPTNVTVAAFAWAGLSSTTNYTCTLDGARVGCSAPGGSTAWSYTSAALGDGSHTFSVKAQGHKQNPANYSWRVDTAAPAAPSIVAPPSSTRATSAAISFTDSDAAVTGFTCAADGASPAACQTPYVLSGLQTGSHTVTVTAYDAAGNGAPASVTWTVDPDAPDVPVVIGPASPTNHTDASISFSTVNPTTDTCALDGSAPAACSSPASVTGLADGTHTFTVAATDGAGNSFSDRATWVVDTLAPGAPTLVSGPAATTDDTSPTITFTDDDATGVRYTCTVTDITAGIVVVAPAACASPFDLNLDAGTPDGHQFQAHIVPTDGAGNIGAPLDVSWVLDQTISPSPAKFLVTPSSPSADTAPVLTFDAPDYGQSLGATGFVCTFNGAAVSCPSAVDASGTSLTGTFQPSSPLSDGSYTLSVRTTNGSVQSEPVSWTWLVDTTPPTAPQVSDPGTTPNPTITFTDGDPYVTYLCAVDGAAAVACSSPWTPPADLADGTHQLVVTVVDGAGNRTTAAPVSFTVQRQAAPASQPSQPSQPATQPATQPAAGSLGDTTAPTVAAVAAPRTLTGAAQVTFSEAVTGLAAGSLRITPLGTSTGVPATVTCLSGGASVSCASQWTTARLTPRSPLVVGQRYTVVADAAATHDLAGNGSTAAATPFRAARAVEESSPAVRAAWAPVTDKRALGGSLVREHLAGATAAWRFTGTAVTWWTSTGPDQGRAVVLVDGVKKAAVNNYAAKPGFRVSRLVKGLKKGSHTLTIKVLGRKGASAAKGTFVSVDGFTVGRTRTASPTLAVKLHPVAGTLFSAGHAWTADTTGTSLTLTFRGTSIAWATLRGRNQGKAAVYVDGTLKKTFDGYALHTAKATVTVGKLADRTHTLRIVVLGKHHRGGTGNLVTLDRLTAG